MSDIKWNLTDEELLKLIAVSIKNSSAHTVFLGQELEKIRESKKLVCPFCSNEAGTRKIHSTYGIKLKYQCYCRATECQAQGPIFIDKDVAEKWGKNIFKI